MIPPPGRHGGDGPAVAAALGLDPAAMLDLSHSANPCAPDVAAVAATHLASLRTYPDVTRARDALAEHLDTDPARLLLTNGGAEAIALVARTVGGGAAEEPAFSLHPRSATGPRWRADPHSPSGLLARRDQRAGVWDEAFYPVAAGRWSAHRPGTIVVGSLTKVFSCPGLRLGYVVADEVAAIGRRQPEWAVNSLALAVLPDLLQRTDLAAWRSRTAALRRDLVALLEAHDLRAAPSDAPWVLVSAPGLRERLAPHGVLVRDCASFGRHGIARIAVPDERGLERLADALARAELDHRRRTPNHHLREDP